MKRVIPFALVLWLTIDGLAQCADPSNIYRFQADNKTYDVVMELKTWSDAAACSKELGGYLVDILDLEEQIAIFDGIVKVSTRHGTCTKRLFVE